jgi:hypothetical protein
MANEREIALRALRAAGHDQAAELVEAIIPAGSADPAANAAVATPAPAPAATPAATPEIPSAPLVPAPVAAAQAAGPQPPPGKAPLTVADLSTISQAEAVARMDEVEWLERAEAR